MNGAYVATNKRNGHPTFQCVIDYWGTRSNAKMPGAILSFNVVHLDSVVIIVLLKKVNKQVEGKLGILS